MTSDNAVAIRIFIDRLIQNGEVERVRLWFSILEGGLK